MPYESWRPAGSENVVVFVAIIFQTRLMAAQSQRSLKIWVCHQNYAVLKTKDTATISGWAKQNSENSGLFRNFLNAFWLSYPHPHSIGPFLCRKFSLIILCILLFARVHFRISCIYEKDVQKEKVNTGMTRIFRQHKFIAFRYLNVYYKKPKPKLKSLYVLLVSEIFT